MKVMFLDESGDHSLAKIDPQYPLFVLGGIIVDHAYAVGELTERLQRFKRDLFGSSAATGQRIRPGPALAVPSL